MQALAERFEAWLGGATFEGYVPLGFTGLKTAVPSPDELIGRTLVRVGRRAKYVMLHFERRARATRRVPSLPSGPGRLRAAAEADKAEGFGGALEVLR